MEKTFLMLKLAALRIYPAERIWLFGIIFWCLSSAARNVNAKIPAECGLFCSYSLVVQDGLD